MQTKQDLEKWYKDEDPWGYFDNPQDKDRRKKIIEVLNPYNFQKALDIGAGEGFITRILPAKEIYFQEISDTASNRHPKTHKRVHFNTKETFDLVVATGVFYKQYDWEEMHDFALRTLQKGGILLTVHIDSWEIPIPNENLILIHDEKYPYREYAHKLKIYKKI